MDGGRLGNLTARRRSTHLKIGWGNTGTPTRRSNRERDFHVFVVYESSWSLLKNSLCLRRFLRRIDCSAEQERF
jgi:hypothetical protein